MGEKEVQHILIGILYSALNEVENDTSIKEKLTPDIFESLYHLAKKHDLAHILYDYVCTNKIEVEPELRVKLQREKYTSIFRCEQIKFVLEEVCIAFDEAKISYVPLKGSVIRPYYPFESMRTSCDVDILIHEAELDSAIIILESKGYRCEGRNYHDISLYSPSNVHLELHFNIQENMDNIDAVLKDAWKYVIISNECQSAFQKDFFVFHIYAHMAYHFLSGGCGIRSLMDIWVMENKMNATHSCAEKLLKKAGVYQFAVEMTNLAEQCFTANNIDSFSDTVLNYIFNGGVYGCAENNITVKKLKTKSPVVYVLKRLFLPYKSMVTLFPFLKKSPYLLPFCWVARWLKAIFGGKSKRIISEISRVNNISDNKIEELKKICSQLGL